MDFNQDIEQCLKVLEKGGLILYPTDTIWGIGCDATNESAVSRIFLLKKREETKAMVVLLANERDLMKHVANPDPAVFDFLKEVDKPTTIIYEGALGFADNLLAKDGSVGIRIVRDDFCRHLIKRFRKPLVSTSANISGQTAPSNFSEISEEILNGVDYIVRYRQDDTGTHSASSIIKWKNGKPELIRS